MYFQRLQATVGLGDRCGADKAVRLDIVDRTFGDAKNLRFVVELYVDLFPLTVADLQSGIRDLIDGAAQRRDSFSRRLRRSGYAAAEHQGRQQ